jgi:ankyrin repeat protein
MVDIEGRTALHWTADHTTDETLLAVMTAYPPLLNRKDVYGMTALHLAASKGSVVVVETLLTMANIEIELEDATGRTPLHWGCVSGSVGVVTRLLQYGASETAVDKEGYTPLHCAVQHGHYTVVSVLTTLAVPTHVADNAGRTPLMWAAYSTQEIMNELLSNKKIRQDVNLKDLNGKTALHFASEVGSAACVESLLKSGAGANSQDNNGQTALVLACIGGHTECIKTLAAHKCDLDVVDSVGNTAAHNAILYCSSLKRMDEQEKMTVVTSVSECLVVLGFEGANFDLLNNGGSAAIHLAVDCGSDLLTEALLRGLANPNVQDSNGYTPLHQAVMQGLDSIVSILLKYNAHVSLSDNTSKRYTPLDLAIFYDQTACIELLKSSGALSQDDIKDFAATCIQSVYKGYRARKVYQEKLSRKKAVTVISAAWKGYKARKSYLYKVIRNRAATKIQTVFRGYRQRRKFADVLKTHLREKECKELIEDFKAHNLHNDSHSIVELITIEPVSGAKFPHSSPASQRERKMRLEQAMKLRKMCMIRETTWAAFRVAEEKRRIDKANRIESERLAQILQHSQDRRKFIEHKKTHTWTLRSQVRAAVVIQRAFRKWKASNELRQRSIEDATRQLLAMETEAARRIQIAWRNYRRHCNFIQQYYRVIPTAPTVVPQRSDKVPVKTFISPLKKSVSFTDNILITGKPRHKLNLTLTSGIKLVNRPFTTAHRPRAPGEPVFKRNMSHGHLVSPRGKVDPRNYNRAWAAGVLASPKTSVSVFTTNAHSSMPEMSMTARKLVSPPGSHVISPPKSYVVSPPRSHVVSPPRSHVVSPPKSGGETTESSFHLPAIVGK